LFSQTAMPERKTKHSKFTNGVAILGAGASSRMGRPKLLLPWNDTTVIGQIIRQWRELGAAQIAVVHRPNDAALFAELGRLNFPASDRIENSHPERGMFSSVICAANWAGWQKKISTWAIALGDQPHLQTAALRSLLEFAGRNAAAVCQPEFGGHGRHPVILPHVVFDELKSSHAGSLKEFLKSASCRTATFAVNDPGLALDLDTPEDYQRAQPGN
jgi:molybdenum cofactor cytidylyltransferase